MMIGWGLVGGLMRESKSGRGVGIGVASDEAREPHGPDELTQALCCLAVLHALRSLADIIILIRPALADSMLSATCTAGRR